LAIAAADPYFYIDPSFPDAPDYQLYVSDGVSNQAAGAPEPALWLTMLLGFGGAGAALRRRPAVA
jgi:MYXO-CTERM domain-containing protein